MFKSALIIVILSAGLVTSRNLIDEKVSNLTSPHILEETKQVRVRDASENLTDTIHRSKVNIIETTNINITGPVEIDKQLSAALQNLTKDGPIKDESKLLKDGVVRSTVNIKENTNVNVNVPSPVKSVGDLPVAVEIIVPSIQGKNGSTVEPAEEGALFSFGTNLKKLYDRNENGVKANDFGDCTYCNN